MTFNKIYIFGGGSSAKNIIKLIEDCNLQYKKIFIVDKELNKKKINQIYKLKVISERSIEKDKSNIGICSIADPKIRKRINYEIESIFNLEKINLIHPKSIISKNVKIGKGVIIFSGARVNHNSKISDGCLINYNVDIGHDVKIGSNSSILTNVLILGNVRIGNQVLIGAGSKVLNQIKIGNNTKIAFATNVTKNIASNRTVKQRFELLEFKNLN